MYKRQEKNYLIKKDFLTIDYTVEVHGEDSLLWSFHYEKNTPLAATQLQAQFWDENGIKELSGENFATKDGWLKEMSAAFGNNQSKGTLKAHLRQSQLKIAFRSSNLI